VLQRVKKSNCRSEIELLMSTILKFEYYETPCNVKKIRTGDLLKLFAKNHAFQKLIYLASISTLRQVVVY
jgi:hypothetical protein